MILLVLLALAAGWVTTDLGVGAAGLWGVNRSERFYYDGIRRIQEVVADPILAIDDQLVQSDPGLQAAAAAAQGVSADPLDEHGTPMLLESEQDDTPGLPIVTYLDREYVWGPGDNGVDELLVQYDRFRQAGYAVTDEGGDIVALCDLGGPGGTPRVVAQYTYDAYGQPVTATHFYAHGSLRCGHKGLFVDRLDAGVLTSGVETPRLVPFAHQIVQNRNRVYVPQMGRFLQPDPKETGQALMAAASRNGRGMESVALVFDLEGMYGDGLNRYEYLGSNPWNRRDPLGLSWDPFDLVDEYLAATTGERAALLSQLGQSARAFAVVTATIASYMPFPVVGTLGDMALYALGEQVGEEVAMGIAIGMIPGGKLIAGVGKMLKGIGSSAWSAAKHYAGRFTGALGGMAGGLFARAKEFIHRKPAACGCFAASTLVWTVHGLMPIEAVRTGELVLARDATGALVLRPVEAEIVTYDVSLLTLVLCHTNGRIETISTTDEHPFWVPGRGWMRADALRPGDAVEKVDSKASIVMAVAYTSERTTVYNLTVDSDHNYFVGADGILVHNGSIFDCLAGSRLFPDSRKFEKAFEKHGAAFGITSNSKTVENITAFERNVMDFMASARTKQINYYGSGPAVVYFKGPDRPVVVTRPDGSWWTGYKLSESQFREMMERGILR